MQGKITTFKAFYNRLALESVVLDPDTGNVLVNDKPSGSNIELIKPVFSYRNIAGLQSIELKANPLHNANAKVFYGYDVFDPVNKNGEPGDIKNRIYAAFKGVAGKLKNFSYNDKDWTDPDKQIPLTVVNYEKMVNKAAEEYAKKTQNTFNLIVYLQSRAPHSLDVAERVFGHLKSNGKVAPECELAELKKIQVKNQKDIENMVTQLFNFEEFAADLLEEKPHLRNIEGIEDIAVWIEIAAKAVLTEIITRRFNKSGDNTLSVATHIRPLANSLIAEEVLKRLHKEIPEVPEETSSLGNRFLRYQKASHYNLSSIMPLLKKVRSLAADKVQVLVVDDNTNTGDTFKQMRLLMEDIKKEFGEHRIFNWEYFILMKDASYDPSDMALANRQSIETRVMSQRQKLEIDKFLKNAEKQKEEELALGKRSYTLAGIRNKIVDIQNNIVDIATKKIESLPIDTISKARKTSGVNVYVGNFIRDEFVNTNRQIDLINLSDTKEGQREIVRLFKYYLNKKNISLW